MSSERTRSPVSLHGGHTTAVDGRARPRDMVEAAERAGFEIYGLSEHFYRPRDPRFRYSFELESSDWGRSGWPAFAAEVLAEKERCRAEGGPTVLLGAEVEYLPGFAEWTERELAKWPIDYRVLSVHFFNADGEFVPFDLSPKHWGYVAERCGGVVQLFARYFDQILEALSWDVADVLGHVDLIKIYADGPVSHPEIDARLDRIAERCAETGAVLDLNARGLVKPCGEVYPSIDILRRARAAGVDLVPGDDSHAPDQVGLNLDRALEHARRAGYREIALPRRLGGRRWKI